MYTGEMDVMLYVTDLAKSVAFYRDLLGIPMKGIWSDEKQGYVTDPAEAGASSYAALNAGGAKVSLHTTEQEVTAGGMVLHLGVEDVDALHERLEEAGVQHAEPQNFPWGWRMCFVRDPDGHWLGLFTNLD